MYPPHPTHLKLFELINSDQPSRACLSVQPKRFCFVFLSPNQTWLLRRS